MSPQDDDDLPLTDIPAIVPDRDDAEHYHRSRPGRQKAVADPMPADDEDDYAEEPAAPGRGALYALAAVAAVALAWAGFLQFQLAGANSALDAWQARVADLEKRLSVTDESATQSSATLQVKLKELDDALARLRDENLKKARTAIDQHTTQLAALEQTLKATQASAGKAEKVTEEQQKTLDAAKAQLDKLAPTVELSKRKLEEQQAAIESLTEKGNITAANVEKLGLRMNTNEEWVQSINNFRKQTNREIVNLKQQIGGPVSEPAPK